MNAVSTHDHDHPPAKAGDNLGGRAFVWLAWLVAFGFWALTVSTAFGILSAMGGAPVAPGGDGAGSGGIQWGLITVVGVIALGVAMAWAAFRYATRNKRLDAVTERATHELYDAVEAAGGDDAIATSPEAEKRGEPLHH